jgi:regulatory protein
MLGGRPGNLPAGPDPDFDVGLAADVAARAGPERRRGGAFDAAWRFLAHRDRTEAEVRARLERNDVEPELADEVLATLKAGGYVDDAGFARRFAEDRRNLDGWGAERIERRLRELGVAREHVRAALAAGAHDELDAACELLARRFPQPPDTPRELERALGFLVRKGYELELAHDALRRHAAATIEG